MYNWPIQPPHPSPNVSRLKVYHKYLNDIRIPDVTLSPIVLFLIQTLSFLSYLCKLSGAVWDNLSTFL